MSGREQYTVPTGQSQTVGLTGQKSFGGGQDLSVEGPPMQYLCGDCGVKTTLRRADPIRCKECGCRVLYKERTKR